MLVGGGVMSRILVSAMALASCDRMVSMKCRMLAEKVASGTQPSSASSTGGMGRKASLAPRKMVKSRIGGWLGEVDWVMMPVKSSRISVEV